VRLMNETDGPTPPSPSVAARGPGGPELVEALRLMGHSRRAGPRAATRTARSCIGCSPWVPLWVHTADARYIRVSPLDAAEHARTGQVPGTERTPRAPGVVTLTAGSWT